MRLLSEQDSPNPSKQRQISCPRNTGLFKIKHKVYGVLISILMIVGSGQREPIEELQTQLKLNGLNAQYLIDR
jgi:hypothetical protein